MNKWEIYYKNTKNNPPSHLLTEAVPFVVNKNQALDLGAGALNDSKYLLTSGFSVVAVDKEKFSEQVSDEKYVFVQSLFKDYNFPEDAFDLINAQFSLPFNDKESFLVVWEKVINSLGPKGVFTGQLFGLRDEWNVPGSKLVFHSRDEVVGLLSNLDILKLEEIEEKGKIADGTFKHWHYFNIIACKK